MFDEDTDQRLIHNLAIPAAMLFAGCLLFRQIFKYISTLRVDGKANEWVLILNNGQMKTCGIGLKTFRGPFDQVTSFPSKVNMVNFTTEQVTKEMQGVKVTGMLVWSIRRTEDGPFNAYKNLGDDLASGNPTTANDNLVSMASAIVRAAIANSTITDMLKKRDSLKATILKDMDAVVKGWGVWLETVEITDVQISSHNLFKDLQAAFREEKKKDAEVYTMGIEQDLAADLTTRQLRMKEITDKNQKERSEFEARLRMETQDELAQHQEKIAEIDQKKEELTMDLNIQKKEIRQNYMNQYKEKEQEYQIFLKKNEMEQVDEDKMVADANFQYSEIDNDHSLKLAQLQNDQKLKISEEEAKMLGENLNEKVMRYNAMESAKKCLQSKRFMCQTMKSGENDAVTQLAARWFNQSK